LLNSLLEWAYIGSTTFSWYWYLATTDYSAAPRKRPDGRGQQGTVDPVNPSFSSPFAGKSLDDAARWLRSKPQQVDLDPRFFGVLDKQARISGRIAICRLEDPQSKWAPASCLLYKAEESSLHLAGLDSELDWNELVNLKRYIPEV
ncbi:MAG: hypothetical protein Q9222_004972, partial [Ikaeria aurantiellina]